MTLDDPYQGLNKEDNHQPTKQATKVPAMGKWQFKITSRSGWIKLNKINTSSENNSLPSRSTKKEWLVKNGPQGVTTCHKNWPCSGKGEVAVDMRSCCEWLRFVEIFLVIISADDWFEILEPAHGQLVAGWPLWAPKRMRTSLMTMIDPRSGVAPIMPKYPVQVYVCVFLSIYIKNNKT